MILKRDTSSLPITDFIATKYLILRQGTIPDTSTEETIIHTFFSMSTTSLSASLPSPYPLAPASRIFDWEVKVVRDPELLSENCQTL